ncbi:hypothetical protein Tco_1312425 [Tanacetum coccineum]
MVWVTVRLTVRFQLTTTKKTPVEEVPPVKLKKPSRRATRGKKDEPKEPLKDWTMAEEIALCQAWCDVSENNIAGNSMKSKGFWDAVIKYFVNETGSSRGYDLIGRKKSKASGSASGGFNLNEEVDEAVDEVVKETQEFRPMGRDRAKAKKKTAGFSRDGSSSFVDLVAEKFFNIKQKNEKRRTSNNRPI